MTARHHRGGSGRPYHPTHRPPPGRNIAGAPGTGRRALAQWSFVVLAVAGTYVGLMVTRSDASSEAVEEPVVGEALREWEADLDRRAAENDMTIVSGENDASSDLAPEATGDDSMPDPIENTVVPDDDSASSGLAAEPAGPGVSDGDDADDPLTDASASDPSEPELGTVTDEGSETLVTEADDVVDAESGPSTSVAPPTTENQDADVLDRRVIDLIGDEILAQAEAELRVALAPGSVDIAARAGATLVDSRDSLQAASIQGRVDSVVVAVGRHDPESIESWVADVATTLDILADVPCVVWVDIHEDSDAAAERNELTEALAGTRSNVRLASWSAVSETEGLVDDSTGTLTELGRARLAILVGATVRTCFGDGTGSVIQLDEAGAELMQG